MFARLLRGIGANAFSQFVIIGVQLALVPILATHWGLKVYGTWLMLFTIPSYLALGDFGFATAAGVDMTMKVARGDRADATVTYHSALAAILAISTVILAIAWTICSLLPTRAISFDISVSSEDIRIVLCLISAYGIICLASSVLMAGFRCSGFYATGVITQSFTQLIESGACISVVVMGGSLRAAAIAYLSARVTCVIGQAWILSHKVPWLTIGIRGARLLEIKRLAHPALAALALPFSQAIFLQGTPVVLGAATTPATVPVFTTVRTLIRAGVQLTTLLNHAIMPEFSGAVARGDQRTQRGFLFATLATNAGILIPGAIVLLLWGQQIVSLWTHGAVRPPWVLIAVMTATMVVNGMWHPVSNLILAANRHATYSYFYLIAATLSVAICCPLSIWKQAVGAGISLLILDSVMFIVVMRLAHAQILKKANTPSSDPAEASEHVGEAARQFSESA
jgi:O-antigen/teichoic acid export membrane protein